MIYVNTVYATPVDQQSRGDLLCAISLFGSIVHDVELFKRIISEELMQESKYYQLLRDEFIAQGLEQGLEQGTRETTIKNTLALLNEKFAVNAVNDLIPVLQRITDLQQLEQLHLAAAQVQSLDAFKLMLD